jgi:hypothetical protein
MQVEIDWRFFDVRDEKCAVAVRQARKVMFGY